MSDLILNDIDATSDILEDMKSIIDLSKQQAFQTVNLILIRRNWMLGHRIATEEMNGNGRAEYGSEIIAKLSKQLTMLRTLTFREYRYCSVSAPLSFREMVLVR